MAKYLTKEEIKQWRSSLEKITLEEFAARLGKSIEEAKLVDDDLIAAWTGHPHFRVIDNSSNFALVFTNNSLSNLSNPST